MKQSVQTEFEKLSWKEICMRLLHCFGERTTGNIFKPAGWKSPYTKGMNAVRGNIYDASTFEKTDLHGGWLYVG